MRSMKWQLGILDTISAFAYRHRNTEKNLTVLQSAAAFLLLHLLPSISCQ